MDDADGADDADGGSALEEAEKGIDRTSHGNSSALGHRYCTGWGTLRNRCTAHNRHSNRSDGEGDIADFLILVCLTCRRQLTGTRS